MPTKFVIKGVPVLYHRTDSDIVDVRLITNVGSFNEKSNQHGMAHVAEHLFFKGTTSRNTKEINMELCNLGQCNAYTSYEGTTYYLTTVNTNFKKTLSLLCDMFFNYKYNADEFELEKNVICEEIQTRQDDPHIYFYDKGYQEYIGKAGHNIAGTKDIVSTFTLANLLEFIKEYNNDFIFSVCGNVSKEDVVGIFNDLLSKYSNMYVREEKNINMSPDVDFTNIAFNHVGKQSMISYFFKGLSTADVRLKKYTTNVLRHALGGGMHSILFNKLREDLGLCYSTAAWSSTFKEFGIFGISCALSSKNIDKACSEIKKVICDIKNKDVSEKLLSVSKNSMLFNIKNNNVSSKGFNRNMSEDYFTNGREIYDIDNHIKCISEVSVKDIKKVANEILRFDSCKYIQMN